MYVRGYSKETTEMATPLLGEGYLWIRERNNPRLLEESRAERIKKKTTDWTWPRLEEWKSHVGYKEGE